MSDIDQERAEAICRVRVAVAEAYSQAVALQEQLGHIGSLPCRWVNDVRFPLSDVLDRIDRILESKT